MSKKIIVVATGGTIAMKYDPQCQGLVPACSGEDLALAVPCHNDPSKHVGSPPKGRRASFSR